MCTYIVLSYIVMVNRCGRRTAAPVYIYSHGLYSYDTYVGAEDRLTCVHIYSYGLYSHDAQVRAEERVTCAYIHIVMAYIVTIHVR